MSEERADRVFHALSDATRRDIVALALQGEYSVSELARRYPMSFAAVQKHVAVLERAGLVSKHRQGREQRVRGEVATVREVHHLLDAIEMLWRGRLERIEDLLASPPDSDGRVSTKVPNSRPEIPPRNPAQNAVGNPVSEGDIP